MEHLAAEISPDNVQRVRSELDGLAAVLESHFQWEERRLTAALNSLHSFYLACGYAAAYGFAAANPSSTAPLIGASGAGRL